MKTDDAVVHSEGYLSWISLTCDPTLQVSRGTAILTRENVKRTLETNRSAVSFAISSCLFSLISLCTLNSISRI